VISRQEAVLRGTGIVLTLLSIAAWPGCDRSVGPVPPETVSAPVQKGPDPSKDLVYVCPMDRDIRSNGPGACPRCGMKLVAGIPEPVEFHLDLTVSPPPTPGERVHLNFVVHDPWKNNPVRKFSIVHEKLFHAFIVSRDLQFFVHSHPTWENGSFSYDIAFPKPGMYRILGDFYPEAATPQLLTKTVFVAGTETPPAPLRRDYSSKDAENSKVDFSTTPPQAVAGLTTQMRFNLSPADGLERYLGVWAHMLAASDDLIDMIHTHPFIADGGPKMQFDVVFPRSRTYRVWVQFQRKGVVNTVHFDVPVNESGTDPFGRTR
jgi:Heavy metal binding domain